MRVALEGIIGDVSVAETSDALAASDVVLPMRGSGEAARRELSMLIEPSVSWVDVVIVVCAGARARAHVCVFLMLSRLFDVLWTFEVCSLHASLPTRTISSGFQLGITIYTSRSM